MALLTADDVYSKQFAYTKFREGYDQEEVDEFLDQVVETMATMAAEREKLIADLEQARLAAGGELPVYDNSEAEALRGELAQAQERIAQLEAAGQGDEAQAVVAQLQADLAQAQEANANANAEVEALRGELAQAREAAPSNAGDPADATSMLALAQRVHDEYVRNGQEEGEKIISDSRAQAEEIVANANAEKDQITAQLEAERSELQSKLDELKSFEADYRNKLRTQLQGLLEAVES